MATTAQHPAPVHYRVEMADLHAHLFGITLTIARPASTQELVLPVWIPGSYLVREFSKNLQGLQARQGKRRVPVRQLDKHRWQVDAKADQPLTVQYQVYAFDNSVRTAWLDSQRGFFNSTSLCLQVAGQQDQPHTLELVATDSIAHWAVETGATTKKVDKNGFGTYLAPNYDTLVDCPFELGTFWSGNFTAAGIPHRFVVAGASPSFDGAKLLADTRAICEAEMAFWHGNAECYKTDSTPRTSSKRKQPIPFTNYVFMLNAVGDGYGGLEHANSTALIGERKDLPRLARTSLAPTTHKQPEGYTTLLGLISHEYFHSWNVKRLRPQELAQYDYTRENYTALLWFFEGFTSYYDDLLLRRAQLIDDTTYLKLLNKTINQVAQTPGRKLQSVAQASFDAWVKYYRQDENTPNATVSYYTKGSLVALCLDLTLRAHGSTSLDAVMRGLWQRCKAGPMTESDFSQVLQSMGGRSFATEIRHWVHGTQELPLKDLLQSWGVTVLEDRRKWHSDWGCVLADSGGVQIKAGTARRRCRAGRLRGWRRMAGPGAGACSAWTIWHCMPAPRARWWRWSRATGACCACHCACRRARPAGGSPCATPGSSHTGWTRQTEPSARRQRTRPRTLRSAGRQHRPPDLRTLAAEHRHHLAVLVRDTHVVDAMAALQRLLLADAGEQVAQLRRAKELDAAAGRHGGLVVAVAGEREGRVGQCEDEATMADAVAVEQLGAHGQAHGGAAGRAFEQFHLHETA
jgi:predicted metalloprotease with PDZ domain